MKAPPITETQYLEQLIGEYKPKLKGFSGGLCQRLGWKVQHIETVMMKGYGKDRWINKTPGTKGYPDLTLVKKGRMAFIEVKGEGNYAEPEQIEWLNEACGKEFLLPADWRSRGAVPDGYAFGDVADEGPWWAPLTRLDGFDAWHMMVALVRPRHLQWLATNLR